MIQSTRQSRRHQRQVVRAAIEALPNRLLLSVSLQGKTIDIVGTDSADHITVAADRKFMNIADVDVNGAMTYFALSAFQQIDIQALAGNDRIIVDSSLDSAGQPDFVDGQMSDTTPGIPTRVDGGAGDDTITTAAGNDTLSGGDGNDRINANGGSDWLQGDAGNDTLNGGDQNDALVGGAGNDSLSGGNGRDTLSDSAGQDQIHGNGGADIINASDSGNLYGDAGSDTITSTAEAYVYGGDGDDTLTGSTVWGGDGDDSITGTDKSDSIHGDDGNDTIHGSDGNDLIYGDDGSDQIFGDGDNDALYGGSMSDTIHGGAGDDNLYGDDGIKDKNHTDDGNDAGYGDAGSDWFEPTHAWAVTDYNPKQDSKQQIHLFQDPSYISGDINETGTGLNLNYGSGTIGIGSLPVTPIATDLVHDLGQGGFLATGSFASNTNSIVPAELDKVQRTSLKPVIMQLPPTWKVGKMLTAKDDIIWYRLSGETILPITISDTVPGAASGVDSYYRFLAVKRGTILISSAQNPTALSWYFQNRSTINLPARGTIWTAGDSIMHALLSTQQFDLLPDVPSGHSILFTNGVFWIPPNGTPRLINE